MDKIIKKKTFFGGESAGILEIQMTDDYDIKFLKVSDDGEAMVLTDYQGFEKVLHDLAHICIKKDDLRKEYLEFETFTDQLIHEWCVFASVKKIVEMAERRHSNG